jgi:hypothetical protein
VDATSFDQPALRRLNADEPAPAGPVLGEVMVMFLDKSSRLCRVTGWKQDRDRAWWCWLRWSVSGAPFGAWYLFDTDLVQPLGDRSGTVRGPFGDRSGTVRGPFGDRSPRTAPADRV